MLSEVCLCQVILPMEKEQIWLGNFKMNFLGRFDSCCMSLLKFIKLLRYQIPGIMCRDSQDPGK